MPPAFEIITSRPELGETLGDRAMSTEHEANQPTRTDSVIPLDPDEVEHYQRAPATLRKRIAFANVAAYIAVGVLTSNPVISDEKTPLNSPVFIQALLALKSANLLRLATFGLYTGYYAGSSVLLRAAFEAAALSILFTRNPKQIRSWLRAELHPKLSGIERGDARRKLMEQAKDAFASSSEHGRSERALVDDLWDLTCTDIHGTVTGLADSHGVNPWDLLPDELLSALEATRGDLAAALDFLSKPELTLKPFTGRQGRAAAGELIEVALFGGFDEDQAGLIAEMLLYVSHRLLDHVTRTFKPVDPDRQAEVKEWHQAIAEHDRRR
ncbi:MAG: hypothetical protein HY678_01005 [Chloroflexi bacterium]|nr:hypothetical protein [Chloroflexota bacterium]